MGELADEIVEVTEEEAAKAAVETVSHSGLQVDGEGHARAVWWAGRRARLCKAARVEHRLFASGVPCKLMPHPPAGALPPCSRHRRGSGWFLQDGRPPEWQARGHHGVRRQRVH